jgi:hypothetical protein
MEQLKFRNLTIDEIEVRVGGGGNLLLYKTARTDAKLLDETVGQLNWQKKFYQVKNTMICSVGINVNYNDPSKEPYYIWKDDAGDDDYTMEKIKAEASDSFKRAGFAWGIGRNLYTAPRIKLDDKFKGKQFFDVEQIGYDKDGTITDLVISTDFGKTIVFSYKNGRKVSQNADLTPKTTDTQPTPTVEEPKGSIAAEDLAKIRQMISLYQRDESRTKFFAYVEKTYNVKFLEELSLSQGKEIVKMLEK